MKKSRKNPNIIDNVFVGKCCKKPTIVDDEETGDRCCINCGLVLEQRTTMLDGRGERSYDKNMDSTIHDEANLQGTVTTGTLIDKSTTDAHGTPLTSQMKSTMGWLSKLDTRSKLKDSDVRNLRYAYPIMRGLSEKLNVNDALEAEGMRIYRRALEGQMVRGRETVSIVAASLYAAIRMYKLPRTLNDVIKQSGGKRKRISAAYRLILNTYDDIRRSIEPPDAAGYFNGVIDRLKILDEPQKEALKRKCLQNMKFLHDTGYSLIGKSPSVTVASFVYCTATMDQIDVNQREVARAAGVTEVSIRNTYRKFMDQLSLRVAPKGP